MRNLAKVALLATDDIVTELAIAQFGAADNPRYRDLARDLLNGYGRSDATPAAQAILDRLLAEAEEREAERLAEVRAETERSIAFRAKIDSERAERYDPPAGLRDILLRTFDGQPLKLRVPIDWIIPV